MLNEFKEKPSLPFGQVCYASNKAVHGKVSITKNIYVLQFLKKRTYLMILAILLVAMHYMNAYSASNIIPPSDRNSINYKPFRSHS